MAATVACPTAPGPVWEDVCVGLVERMTILAMHLRSIASIRASDARSGFGLSVPLAPAFLTQPLPVDADAEILPRERMPMNAMRLPGVSGGHAITSQDIVVGRNCRQVARIDTEGVVAEMIENESSWHGAVELLPCPVPDLDALMAACDSIGPAIAALHGAAPDPASPKIRGMLWHWPICVDLVKDVGIRQSYSHSCLLLEQSYHRGGQVGKPI